VDVDVGAGDIFDNLDFGAMLYLEMANSDWAISLDGLYMNLGARGKTPVTERDAEVGVKQLGITTTAMWRVGSWAEIGVGSDITWQVFPYVRYRFSDLFEISGGYRAPGMDYKTGSGDGYCL